MQHSPSRRLLCGPLVAAGLLVAQGCASTAPAAPTSSEFVVASTTVMVAANGQPYPGAMLIDLARGEPVAINSEAEMNAMTQPIVWVEPADPEIDFKNVTFEEPARFRVREGNGGQLLDAEVKAGATFVVRGADGARFRVTIDAYTPGGRDVASVKLRVEAL